MLGDERDRYGRIVARIEAEGEDVNRAMVTAGLAWHFTRYSNDRALAEAESDDRAVVAGGHWGAPETGLAYPAETGAVGSGLPTAKVAEGPGGVHSRNYPHRGGQAERIAASIRPVSAGRPNTELGYTRGPGSTVLIAGCNPVVTQHGKTALKNVFSSMFGG